MPQEPQECASRRTSEFPFHISSTFGVPYPALRSETPFLYDVDSFPLDRVLAETLGIEDLSKLHIDNPLIKDKGRLMAPLLNRGKRRKFHQCFDQDIASHPIVAFPGPVRGCLIHQPAPATEGQAPEYHLPLSDIPHHQHCPAWRMLD